VQRWDCAIDVIRWRNREIKIELLATELKIYNYALVGCVFESIRRRFWLIWECVIWFCPACRLWEVRPITDCHSGKKIGKFHCFVKRQEVHLSCLRDTYIVCNTWLLSGKAYFDSVFIYLFFLISLKRWNLSNLSNTHPNKTWL